MPLLVVVVNSELDKIISRNRITRWKGYVVKGPWGKKLQRKNPPTYHFSSPLVQKHWKSMDHLHGLDKHNINCSLKARRFTVCSSKHALSIQVFITLELLEYLPSYRTKLQCLKQVSRTPCLPWSIIITNVWPLANLYWNPQESVLFCGLGFTAVFEIPNLLWRLVSDHCKIFLTGQFVDDTNKACWTENTYVLFLYFFKPW